jgi:hypothetical protein
MSYRYPIATDAAGWSYRTNTRHDTAVMFLTFSVWILSNRIFLKILFDFGMWMPVYLSHCSSLCDQLFFEKTKNFDFSFAQGRINHSHNKSAALFVCVGGGGFWSVFDIKWLIILIPVKETVDRSTLADVSEPRKDNVSRYITGEPTFNHFEQKWFPMQQTPSVLNLIKLYYTL